MKKVYKIYDVTINNGGKVKKFPFIAESAKIALADVLEKEFDLKAFSFTFKIADEENARFTANQGRLSVQVSERIQVVQNNESLFQGEKGKLQIVK